MLSSLTRLFSSRAQRRWVALRMVARLGLWAVGLVWALLLLAWLGLYWLILPHIQDWRPHIERQATQLLGAPVHIARIDVTSGGWIPAITLRDVVIDNPQGQAALRLPRVAAAVSPRTLLALSPRFEQLLIEAPQLDVRLDKQGQLWVAGLLMKARSGTPGKSTPSAALDWLFQQHEVALRHGQIQWVDEQRGAPALTLSDLDVVLRNSGRSHRWRIDASPPPEWGDRFSLSGDFRGALLSHPGDWRRWTGTAYASLPYANVASLRRHATLPFELTEGDGRVRAWAELAQGELHGLTLDLALRAVNLRLSPTVEPLNVAQLQGRLTWQRDSGGMGFAAQGLRFTTGDGVQWPASDFKVAWRQREATAKDTAPPPVTSGDITADRIDLGLTAQVAERLPLGKAVNELLTDLAPQGVVQGLTAHWEGPLSAPTRYQVKTRVTGLRIEAKASPVPGGVGRPGWRGADLELTATDRGGDARLQVKNGAAVLPGVFAEPEVPLERLTAALQWRVEPSKAAGGPSNIELKVTKASFANADLQGDLQATWRNGQGEQLGRGGRLPGVLDMSGKLGRSRAAAVARYLPLGIPEDTRLYVQHAVLGGAVAQASFKVRGDLWDFPFGPGMDGEFKIAARAEDVTLAYVPSLPATASAPAFASPWPAFTRVNGDLVFDRNSMEIRNGRGRIDGFELSKVKGGIADLTHSTLVIEGSGKGPLNDALRYVTHSPIDAMLGHALQQTTATGNAELKLALNIPLARVDDTAVRGNVTLAGNELHLRPEVPTITNARTRIDFTQKGMTITAGTARALGGDLSFDANTAPDGLVRFNAQGNASAEGLRHAKELGWLARLAQSFNGQAPYRLQVSAGKGYTGLTVTSSLQGMGSELPAPLAKAPATALALRYQTARLPAAADTASAALRDTLRVEVGDVLQAQYLREWTGNSQEGEPKVLSGSVAVMDAAPAAGPGVVAAVNTPRLDVDAWQAVVKRLMGPASNGEAEGDDASYLPHRINLRAQDFVFSGRRLRNFNASLVQQGAPDGAWFAQMQADQLAGSVEWHAPRGPANPGRVYARLQRLALPQSEVDGVASLLEEAPSTVPALDIVVDDFELRGKKLGRVEIEATNRVNEQGQREWRLGKLNLANPEAQMTGTGQWVATGPGSRRMVLDFKLDLADSGAFADRLGFKDVLRNGKGKLQGQLSWAGSPLSLDVPSLKGQVGVALDEGQFLKAGPGAGRLISVVSLQGLARRFVGDFRDVFQEGFAFDNVVGDITIDQGVARTNNLRMRGVQAAVLMDGQADIVRETQNLRVVVVPEINAGSASLAYAVINPAIGLGTFLAQLFLSKPLAEANTREFQITGSWVDPKVTQVEHKPVAKPATVASGAKP